MKTRKQFTSIIFVFHLALFPLVFVSCNIDIGSGTSTEPEMPVHTHQWGAWTVTSPITSITNVEETRICALDATHTETRTVTLTIYLSSFAVNTASSPYTLFMNLNSITGLRNALYTNLNKYVYLDLSGSTFSSIEAQAFFSCYNLTDIKLPDSVTSIGYKAFGSCYGLTSIKVGKNVTNIERESFSSCTSLVNVSIENGVTSIGESAFFNCTSLADITIPDSVSNIGIAAFIGCSSLISVTFEGTIPSSGFDSTYPSFPGDLGDKYLFLRRCTSMYNGGCKLGQKKYVVYKIIVINARGTSFNRIVCASPPVGGSGFRSLGRLRLPRSLHPHSSPPRCFATLYGRAGTSHTTGTLCEMPAKWLVIK